MPRCPFKVCKDQRPAAYPGQPVVGAASAAKLTMLDPMETSAMGDLPASRLTPLPQKRKGPAVPALWVLLSADDAGQSGTYQLSEPGT